MYHWGRIDSTGIPRNFMRVEVSRDSLKGSKKENDNNVISLNDYRTSKVAGLRLAA